MHKYYDAALTLEGEEKEAIIMILNLKRRLVCEICGGMGHLMRKCATRRDLDRTFKGLGLKTQWGELKSQIIKDSIEVNIFSKQEKKIITEKYYKKVQDDRKINYSGHFKKSRESIRDNQENKGAVANLQYPASEKKDLAGNRWQQQ